jgi:hypothetical protein
MIKIAKQERTIKYCLSRLKLKHQAGIIIAEPVGTGKTIIALEIVKRLQKRLHKRCLVIVPSRDLRDHWESQREKVFGGVEKGIEIITKREFNANDYNVRGKHIIILDEAHHFKEGTKGFDNFIERFRDKKYKKILLTATPLQLTKYELLDLYILCGRDPNKLKDQKHIRVPNIENVSSLRQLRNKFEESKQNKALDFKFWLYAHDYCGRKCSTSNEAERKRYKRIWRESTKDLENIMRPYFVRHKKNHSYRHLIPDSVAGIAPSQQFCDYYFEVLLELGHKKKYFREQKLWEICSSPMVFNNYLKTHPDLKIDKACPEGKLGPILNGLSLDAINFNILLKINPEIYSGYEEKINPSEKILVFTQFIRSANEAKRRVNEEIKRKVCEEIKHIKVQELKDLFDETRGEIKPNKKQYDVFSFKCSRTPIFLAKRERAKLPKELLSGKLLAVGAHPKTPNDLLEYYYGYNRFYGDVPAPTFYQMFKSLHSRDILLKQTAWLPLREYLIGERISRNETGGYIHEEIDGFLKLLLSKFRKDPVFVHAFARACKDSASVEEAVSKFFALLDYTSKESILFEVLAKERRRIKEIRTKKDEPDEDSKGYFAFLRCNHYGEVYTSENEFSEKRSKRIGHKAIRRSFNTCFCPRILIMSPIGREGIDFHEQCRVALHYDLWWNPAVIEQRNGRIDRIGSLYERLKKKYPNIKIIWYTPYFQHTVDEHLRNRLDQRYMWTDLLLNQKASHNWLASDRDDIKPISKEEQEEYTCYKVNLNPRP